MLFFAALINYARKAVVGLTAVPIMQELDLTPEKFGFLGVSSERPRPLQMVPRCETGAPNGGRIAVCCHGRDH
jgi:hypothetical protein